MGMTDDGQRIESDADEERMVAAATEQARVALVAAGMDPDRAERFAVWAPFSVPGMALLADDEPSGAPSVDGLTGFAEWIDGLETSPGLGAIAAEARRRAAAVLASGWVPAVNEASVMAYLGIDPENPPEIVTVGGVVYVLGEDQPDGEGLDGGAVPEVVPVPVEPVPMVGDYVEVEVAESTVWAAVYAMQLGLHPQRRNPEQQSKYRANAVEEANTAIRLWRARGERPGRPASAMHGDGVILEWAFGDTQRMATVHNPDTMRSEPQLRPHVLAVCRVADATTGEVAEYEDAWSLAGGCHYARELIRAIGAGGDAELLREIGEHAIEFAAELEAL